MIFVLSLLCGCFGSIIAVVCGFGLGVFTMIFLPHVMTTTEASTVVCLTSVVQCSLITWKLRDQVQWKDIIPMAIGSLLFVTLTVYFSSYVPDAILRQVLGVLLILLSLYFIFVAKKLTIEPTPFKGFLTGCLGGILSALFGVGGPPASIYYSSCYDDKVIYLATIQAYFLLTNVFLTTNRIINGDITETVLISTAGATIGMLVGTWLGKRLFDRINERLIRLCIYLMMTVSGILLIVQ